MLSFSTDSRYNSFPYAISLYFRTWAVLLKVLKVDRIRPVSQRSKLKSRAVFQVEQTYPWDLLSPQVTTIQHRGPTLAPPYNPKNTYWAVIPGVTSIPCRRSSFILILRVNLPSSDSVITVFKTVYSFLTIADNHVTTSELAPHQN